MSTIQSNLKKKAQIFVKGNLSGYQYPEIWISTTKHHNKPIHIN